MNSFCVVLGLFCIAFVVGEQTVCDLVAEEGYPCEQHFAETSDGFLLSIQRIPYGLREGPNARKDNRPAIFLQHGLLDSAATWVMNPTDQSLGFIFADAGFDVYLGNARGNTWSSNNTKYLPTSDEYWQLIDFDFMISIDLPTMIDKALSISGQSKLAYVGHSQGTIMGFGGFPNNPELANKVTIFLALAPVAWVNHQESFLLTVLAKLDAARWIDLFGFKSFLPSNEVIRYLADTLCRIQPIVCADIIFLLCGWNEENLNHTRLPLYMAHTPAGTSVRNMYHWSQMVRGGKFQKYDYGREGNLKNYGSPYPPEYAPQDMTSPPVAFFTGTRDTLSDPKDVQRLIQALPKSNKPVTVFNQKAYQHLDFTWGVDAHQLIYPILVQLAQKYSPV